MVTDTMLETVTLEVTSCCVCGISFAAPRVWLEKRRRDGSSLFCPNGHSLSFGDNEVARLKRQVAAEQAKREQAEAKAAGAERRADQEFARMMKARQETERLKKRVGNGVCPDCKRHFTNLERHMRTKHCGESQTPPAVPASGMQEAILRYAGAHEEFGITEVAKAVAGSYGSVAGTLSVLTRAGMLQRMARGRYRRAATG